MQEEHAQPLHDGKWFYRRAELYLYVAAITCNERTYKGKALRAP